MMAICRVVKNCNAFVAHHCGLARLCIRHLVKLFPTICLMSCIPMNSLFNPIICLEPPSNKGTPCHFIVFVGVEDISFVLIRTHTLKDFRDRRR